MSINLSKIKREKLLGQLNEIRAHLESQPGNGTNNMLVYLSNLEKEVFGKKYGLIFEEHQEAVDVLLEKNVPVLVEDESLKIDNGGTQNFLIEGDNLASLKLLEKTHQNKIKFIYIDPPYNTGNKDFTYDDRIIDGLDAFRHSKWISFMKSRLAIAKKLMTNDGVIFISIDENEHANLVLLSREIFGEKNFIGSIIIKSNPRGSQSSKQIASLHEYLIVIAKNIDKVAISGHELNEDMLSEYKYADIRGKYRLLGLRQRGGFWRATERPNLHYPFFIDNVNGEISLQSNRKIEVFPFQPTTGEKGTWRWSREKAGAQADELIAKEITRDGQKVWDIFQKDYLLSSEQQKRTKAKSIWDDKELNYQNASTELKLLFDDNVFTYAKPTFLVEKALQMINFDKNSIVLDFFAGSGTTGNAVIKIDQASRLNLSFILCTNNENNICRDITYERIKRVIGREGYAASLKYLKVDFVPINEQLYYEYADKLLLHVKELVELENALDFDGNNQVAICLDDADLKRFIGSLATETTFMSVYVGHDVMVSQECESRLLSLGIDIKIIPDYYYGELRG